MPIDISYNGSSIYTSSSGTDVKLLTSGKFMEDDVLVSIPVGTEGTPTATKGTVTSNSVSVTPSVTNSEGYISGGNHTGTAVTVSASELVSGTKTISASGTTDVTNYANASVESGSATTPATTIIANPSISVSSSGLITASVSASQNVTPTVSAGYVSSGTAGSVAVSGSNTEQLTTQAAQTIHPSTTDQTIASGKYLTGAQTVKGVLLTNLDAGNIKKDVVVKVGDSADDDRIASVIGTYEGSGGGGVTPAEQKDVNFIDYDGAIVYSYTVAEFALLDALPANPSHDGLTAQGWNWTTQEINTQLTAMPDDPVFVGQMYITSDGKTRIYIHLEEGRLSPYFGIAVNGTATVEWGDGSSDSTVTGTSTSTVINTQHNYAVAGDYVIAISVSGSMAFVGSSSYYSQVLWKNSTTATHNRVYQNAIQKVEIGDNASIGDYAFSDCNSLPSITIPNGITSIGNYAFRGCYSLANITIPSGVTSIGNYAFQYCYSLVSTTIPNGITSIGNYAFSYCNSLPSTTIPSGVTSIGNYAFSYCYSLANITIPSGVTSIGYDAFYYCYSLANITIPSEVTSISTSAFSYCYSLANITIPSGVTSISGSALGYCFGLGEIHFIPTTPPTVSNSNAFYNIPTDCIIYVPYSADHSIKNLYTSANNYPDPNTYTYVEEQP